MPDLRMHIVIKGHEELWDYFTKMRPTFEREANRFMHGIKGEVEQAVKAKIPTSDHHKDGAHANSSNSMENGELFMGFYVHTRQARTIKKWREYGYLIFPEEGRGNRNPRAREFFEKTKKEYEPKVYEGLLRAMDKAIK